MSNIVQQCHISTPLCGIVLLLVLPSPVPRGLAARTTPNQYNMVMMHLRSFQSPKEIQYAYIGCFNHTPLPSKVKGEYKQPRL